MVPWLDIMLRHKGTKHHDFIDYDAEVDIDIP